MLFWLRALVVPACIALFALIERLVAFLEWYSHSTEIKFWKERHRTIAPDFIFFEEDDEEAVEDFDVYFNEYDWETEKKDNA